MKTGRFKEVKWFEWVVFPLNTILALAFGIGAAGEIFGFMESRSPFLPDYVPLMIILPQSALILAQLFTLIGITLRLFQKRSNWFFLHTGVLANFGLYIILLYKLLCVQLEVGGLDLKSGILLTTVFLSFLSALLLLYSFYYRNKFTPGKWVILCSSILALLFILANEFSYGIIEYLA